MILLNDNTNLQFNFPFAERPRWTAAAGSRQAGGAGLFRHLVRTLQDDFAQAG